MPTALLVIALVSAGFSQSVFACQLDKRNSAAGASVPATWQPLIDEVCTVAADNNVPGVALVVFDRGEVAAMASSFAPQTPLRWGSITKTVTALAALKLAEQDRLDLDAAVVELLPANTFHNPWAPQQPLTPRMLLELSAGMADLSGPEWDDNRPLPLSQTLPRNRQLLWPPGLQHSYSNIPPGLAAGAIEAASGRTFETYLREEVLLPLGMDQASLQPVADLPGGFQADGTTPIPYWHMTYTAFGALNASTQAMSNLLRMLLQRGQFNDQQLFSVESMAAMFSPGTTLAARRGLQVGYGAGMYSWIRHGHQFWGHGGDADGYLSRYGLLSEAGRGYLVLINADQPATLRTLRHRIEAALTTDLAAAEPPPAVTDHALPRYTGTYYPAAARFRVAAWQQGEARQAEVRMVDDHLEFQRGRRVETLIPLGNGRFRRPQDPVVSVVFAKDESDNLYLFGELGNYVNSRHCPDFLSHCQP